MAARRLLILALLATAFFMLGEGDVYRLNVWNVGAAVLTITATVIGLRRHPAAMLFVASLPVWMLANASPVLMLLAPTMTVGAMVVMLVRFISSMRTPRLAEEPMPMLPQLANGALVAVPPRTFRFQRGVKWLRLIMGICAALVLPCLLLLPSDPASAVALAAVPAIISLSFAFALWLNGRSHYRVDAIGFHRRVFLREETIPWREVTALDTGEDRLTNAYGSTIYPTLDVHSNARVLWFPETLTGAQELARIIEQATGLEFPAREPEPSRSPRRAVPA